jgi:hypothetical protein
VKASRSSVGRFRAGRLAMVVDAGGGDVGVAEPLLDFSNVGRRSKGVGADLKPQRRRLISHQPADRIGRAPS